MTRSFFKLIYLLLISGTSACSGDDVYVTDNNVCKADADQTFVDSNDYSDTTQVSLVNNTDDLARFGQMLSYDTTKMYWGIQIRLKSDTRITGKLIVKVYEDGTRFMTGIVYGDKIEADYSYLLARFSKIHQFEDGKSYWITISPDLENGEQVDWSIGNQLQGLLTFNESDQTWSTTNEQGAYYYLVPCP